MAVCEAKEAAYFVPGKKYQIISAQPGIREMADLIGHTFESPSSGPDDVNYDFTAVKHYDYKGWWWCRAWVKEVPDWTPLGPRLEEGKTYVDETGIVFTVTGLCSWGQGDSSSCYMVVSDAWYGAQHMTNLPGANIPLPKRVAIHSQERSAETLEAVRQAAASMRALESKVVSELTAAASSTVSELTANTNVSVTETFQVPTTVTISGKNNPPEEEPMRTPTRPDLVAVQFKPTYHKLCCHDWVSSEVSVHRWGPPAGLVMTVGSGLLCISQLVVATICGVGGAHPVITFLLFIGSVAIPALFAAFLMRVTEGPDHPIFKTPRANKICVKCGRVSLKLNAYREAQAKKAERKAEKERAKHARITAKRCAEEQAADIRRELERQAIEKLESYISLSRKAKA